MQKLSEICKTMDNIRKMYIMWNGALSIPKKYGTAEDVKVWEDDDYVYFRVVFDETQKPKRGTHHYFGIRFVRRLAAQWERSSYGVYFTREADGSWLGKLPKDPNATA